ncbi:hypothetical protein N2152v2_010161 [Parachlorella kessleri]
MPKRKQASSDSLLDEEEEEQVSNDSFDSDTSSSGVSDSEGLSGDDDSSEDSGDDEDGEAFDSINVDFEFYDPQEKDFHGLKALLHTYLDGEQYNCSELAAVGTVIKCGEDDDPIGVCTVFNLKQHSHLKSLVELKSFLLARCSDDRCKDALQKAWSALGTGLVVSERLINCPPQLAPPLQQNLFEEIQAAAREEETQELRESYFFKRYLMVARAYVDPEQQEEQQRQRQQDGVGTNGKKQKKGKKPKEAHPSAAAPAPVPPSALVYATPEAECFHSRAAWSFTFPVANRPVGKGDLVPHRLVMCVDAAKVPAALDELKALVAAGGGGEQQ